MNRFSRFAELSNCGDANVTQPMQCQKIGGSSTDIIGSSAATSHLRAQIARAASFGSSVLITGPSGSGKELVARGLHTQGPRCNSPFIPVDCASLTGELMASQLFGHVEGAFTGANHSALGCFRAAHGGTIFLDEIGELELPLQAKLLRTLQERIVTPVGSHKGVPIDVRIIAATNRDLRAEATAGRFREDLFYRLNVISIQTIPLRERCEDIPALAATFLAQMATEGLPRRTLSPGAEELLLHFEWPGNIRQLKNFLEQAVISSEQELLTLPLVQRLLEQATNCESSFDGEAVDQTLIDSASAAASLRASSLPLADEDWVPLATVERNYVLHTLEHTYYNQSAAARLLGISRQALIRLMKKMDLHAPRTDHDQFLDL